MQKVLKPSQESFSESEYLDARNSNFFQFPWGQVTSHFNQLSEKLAKNKVHNKEKQKVKNYILFCKNNQVNDALQLS